MRIWKKRKEKSLLTTEKNKLKLLKIKDLMTNAGAHAQVGNVNGLLAANSRRRVRLLWTSVCRFLRAPERPPCGLVTALWGHTQRTLSYKRDDSAMLTAAVFTTARKCKQRSANWWTVTTVWCVYTMGHHSAAYKLKLANKWMELEYSEWGSLDSEMFFSPTWMPA